MQIGLTLLMTDSLPVVMAPLLDQISFLGATASNQLSLATTLKLNIILLPTPLQSFYGYNLYYKNLVLPSPYHLPYGAATSAQPTSPATKCFMNEQNTLKQIFTLSVIVASNAHLKFISSRDQLATPSPKPLLDPKFSLLRSTLNVR